MNCHPKPSLGAACTTKEHLSPKSTPGLSGPRDNPTAYRQQAVYNLWRRMREREGGTRQCPRAEHSQRDKTGVEAQCCHSCSDAALAICSAPLRRAASQDLILSNRRNLVSFSWAENSSPQTLPHQQLGGAGSSSYQLDVLFADPHRLWRGIPALPLQDNWSSQHFPLL